MDSKYNAMRDIVLRHLPNPGNYPASIKGLRIAKRINITDFQRCFYTPVCVLVLQGQKEMLYGSEKLIYGCGKYLISCTDIPVSSRVSKATFEKPFIVLILELDSTIISSLLLETKQVRYISRDEKCLAMADVNEELLDSFYRLVQLLDKPEKEQQVLSPIVMKEIYYRLLTGKLGNQLRLINTKGTRSNQIAQAIHYLKENYSKKLNIEYIAQKFNMAPSSFYRNFKQVTSVTPLQYQKQLRLYEAQRLMLTGNYDAASASYEVGYESSTQFSREYKKMFGAPPKTDIKKYAAL